MGNKTRNLEWRQRDNIDRGSVDQITQVLAATTDTITITHPFVKLDSSAGAVTTLTLPNGEPGQILVLQSIDDNDMDVTPTTSWGWSALALDQTGDQATLLYVNDTMGWIILSLFGDTVGADPVYTID